MSRRMWVWFASCLGVFAVSVPCNVWLGISDYATANERAGYQAVALLIAVLLMPSEARHAR